MTKALGHLAPASTTREGTLVRSARKHSDPCGRSFFVPSLPGFWSSFSVKDTRYQEHHMSCKPSITQWICAPYRLLHQVGWSLPFSVTGKILEPWFRPFGSLPDSAFYLFPLAAAFRLNEKFHCLKRRSCPKFQLEPFLTLSKEVPQIKVLRFHTYDAYLQDQERWFPKLVIRKVSILHASL